MLSVVRTIGRKICADLMPPTRSLLANARRFRDDRLGATALYTGLVGSLVLGAGALSVDVGRMAVLRHEMQNAADAASLGAAAQLDGRAGARERAAAVAQNAAVQTTRLIGNSTSLSVASVEFFRELTPNTVPALGDEDARFVRVSMQPQDLPMVLTPVLELVSGQATARSSRLTAESSATSSPIVCDAPPLMICDPSETLGSMGDLWSPANIGLQMRIKEGPSTGPMQMGNFGALCLPGGECGASAIGDALAAVKQQNCLSSDVETAPGSKTNQVRNGLNARFDTAPGQNFPAPNVIHYPRDAMLEADLNWPIGNGVWDRTGYWNAKHGGAPVPAQLANATRYQTYLYELGETFASNGTATLYPAPAELPPGYTLVTPPGPSVPVASEPKNASDPAYDGVPQSTPVSPQRRLIKVAVLKCQQENVQGHGTYPTHGRFAWFFLTEQVPPAPDAIIFGELVGPVDKTTSRDFHVNAQLIR